VSRARAIVDVGAIRHNVGVIDAHVRGLADAVRSAAVCAVVKADGYGHGAVASARAALDGGARWLAVAHAFEGAELRAAGIDAPVLLLTEPLSHELDAVVEHDLRVAVYSVEGLDRLTAVAARSAQAIRVHLKVNTGMNRAGARPEDVSDLAVRVARTPGLELEGLWTHFASGEVVGSSATAVQLERFAEVRAGLGAAGIEPPLVHASNSGATILRPDAHFDMVRPGLAVYGVAPAHELAGHLHLLPALSLESEVTHVQRGLAGEGVSYGWHHRLARDTVLATVPIGYADGIPRRSGMVGATVLVGGRAVPIVGAVTMDQLVVDVGPTGEVGVGDAVVLVGAQGGERVAVEDWAGRLGLLTYEVLTGIGGRVERVYRGGGR